MGVVADRVGYANTGGSQIYSEFRRYDRSKIREVHTEIRVHIERGGGKVSIELKVRPAGGSEQSGNPIIVQRTYIPGETRIRNLFIEAHNTCIAKLVSVGSTRARWLDAYQNCQPCWLLWECKVGEYGARRGASRQPCPYIYPRNIFVSQTTEQNQARSITYISVGSLQAFLVNESARGKTRIFSSPSRLDFRKSYAGPRRSPTLPING